MKCDILNFLPLEQGVWMSNVLFSDCCCLFFCFFSLFSLCVRFYCGFALCLWALCLDTVAPNKCRMQRREWMPGNVTVITDSRVAVMCSPVLGGNAPRLRPNTHLFISSPSLHRADSVWQSEALDCTAHCQCALTLMGKDCPLLGWEITSPACCSCSRATESLIRSGPVAWQQWDPYQSLIDSPSSVASGPPPETQSNTIPEWNHTNTTIDCYWSDSQKPAPLTSLSFLNPIVVHVGFALAIFLTPLNVSFMSTAVIFHLIQFMAFSIWFVFFPPSKCQMTTVVNASYSHLM